MNNAKPNLLKKPARLLYAIPLSLFFLTISCLLQAQDSSSLYNKAFNLPDKFFGAINSKSERFQQRIARSTERYLHKLSKQERRMQRKLANKDSAAAREMFGDVNKRYDSLKGALSSDPSRLQNIYSGNLDSMQTAIHFLQSNKMINQSPEMQAKLKSALKDYGDIQGKLNQSNFIEQQLKARQQYLKDKLQHFGLGKEIKKYQGKVYYYRSQAEEYKNILEHPQKLETKLLEVARKVPAFSKFFNKHSQLAGLFRLPGNDDVDMVAAEGLQTRSMVMQELEQRLGTGPNVQQYMGSSIANAQSQLSAAKNKLNKLGNAGSDMDMPGFLPENNKTKSFLKRIELGTNIQSTRGNSFLPVTSDIGLSVGYRFSSKAVAGIGGSYKMGWGKSIRHIAISHEGAGIRSFIDWKLKGSIWITGGGEMNYRSRFNRLQELKDYNAWQQSMLAGISKKIKMNKKVKGNFQLLYDFLSRRNIPTTQSIIFRTGYTF